MNPHFWISACFSLQLGKMKQSYFKIYNNSCVSYESTKVSFRVHEDYNFASTFAFKTTEHNLLNFFWRLDIVAEARCRNCQAKIYLRNLWADISLRMNKLERLQYSRKLVMQLHLNEISKVKKSHNIICKYNLLHHDSTIWKESCYTSFSCFFSHFLQSNIKSFWHHSYIRTNKKSIHFDLHLAMFGVI